MTLFGIPPSTSGRLGSQNQPASDVMCMVLSDAPRNVAKFGGEMEYIAKLERHNEELERKQHNLKKSIEIILANHFDADTIVVICAKCGDYIGSKDGQGVRGISHGLCTECAARERAKLQYVPLCDIPATVWSDKG